jgi:N-acetylglutamate synthase-like GNAT family acetyltransferase
MKVRKLTTDYFNQVHDLIKFYSERRLMLPLSLDELYHRAQAYRIIVEDNDRHPAKQSFASDVATKEVGIIQSMCSAKGNELDLAKKPMGTVLACAHLDIFTPQLAEIKSLAVAETEHGKGYGKTLVMDCEQDAKAIGIKKLFVLTFQQDFFNKLGYQVVDRDTLPEKVYKECIKCSYFDDCNEIAMVKNL